MAQNWFKHDYGARNDEKVLELRAEYGWKGYGLFFGLIETMCEQETGAIDTDRIGGLCVAYNLPKDELLAFIDFCIEIELFFEDEDGLIKNGRVIEHLDHMNTLKEAGKKGASKRWKGHKNRGANKGGNATPNADKIRLDKNREESIYPFEDFWDDYDKKKERKKCERKWKRIGETDRKKIKEFIPIYKAHKPDKQFRKYPSTFLNNEIWNDDWSEYPKKHKSNGQKTKGDRRAEILKEDLTGEWIN